jgi:hypothetical protein
MLYFSVLAALFNTNWTARVLSTYITAVPFQLVSFLARSFLYTRFIHLIKGTVRQDVGWIRIGQQSMGVLFAAGVNFSVSPPFMNDSRKSTESQGKQCPGKTVPRENSVQANQCSGKTVSRETSAQGKQCKLFQCMLPTLCRLVFPSRKSVILYI